MQLLRSLSAPEQVAEHLRAELGRGHWIGLMPGVNQLAPELGVSRKTVEAALKQLEHEGLLAGQGPGRKRLIVQTGRKSERPMQVAILYFDSDDQNLRHVIKLQLALVEAGHTFLAAPQTLAELNGDLTRISRVVKQTAADAWIVVCGSFEVLQWFSSQPVPTFALFGRREGVPIAATGPDKSPAMAAATRHLIGLGHRRIVLLARKERRLPEPGRTERAFLDELKLHGVATSEYNLPDWLDTKDGYHALLNSLFQVTPPTAMIIDEIPFFIAAQQFLAGRNIRVPQQISLICTDGDTAYSWCRPAISHIQWDANPLIRRIMRWVASVGRGRRDVRQTATPAKFITGGTTGPVSAAGLKA